MTTLTLTLIIFDVALLYLRASCSIVRVQYFIDWQILLLIVCKTGNVISFLV